ncbi:MAG: pyroglutamyl-peptidase I [Thermotogota bacterium]|nr:pyroglutamyl-peptidase I [Thermotogota bacterium]
MKKIIITGFEPFDKEKINPSQELLKHVDCDQNKIQVHPILLPVTVKEAGKAITDAIDDSQPDYVISFGLNGKLSHIALERVAINIVDAKIPDNNGEQPQDMIINKEGPVAYWSTLPLRTIETNLKKAGIPVKVSNSTGTYICNYVMYSALDFIEKRGLKTKSGFIHIPFLPEQCLENPLRSSMDLSVLKKMLRKIITSLF